MKLYDNVIEEILSLAEQYHPVVLERPERSWKEDEGSVMILRADMAYELGEGGMPGTGLTLITDDPGIVSEDETVLIGKDLSEIAKNTPYARISVVCVDKEIPAEGQALYNTVRNLEYTIYHFHPEGFMMRVSASRHKESVRVGKDALKKGISFADTAKCMSAGFHRHKEVKAVKMIYITDDSFDYKQLKQLAERAEAITKTIDHIALSSKMTDCGVCSLQKVCDEVEGLRELHFRKS